MQDVVFSDFGREPLPRKEPPEDFLYFDPHVRRGLLCGRGPLIVSLTFRSPCSVNLMSVTCHDVFLRCGSNMMVRSRRPAPEPRELISALFCEFNNAARFDRGHDAISNPTTRPCNTESKFLDVRADVIRELTADTRHATSALSLVLDTDWPPRAVVTRVLDVDGREVHSRLRTRSSASTI